MDAAVRKRRRAAAVQDAAAPANILFGSRSPRDGLAHTLERLAAGNCFHTPVADFVAAATQETETETGRFTHAFQVFSTVGAASLWKRIAKIQKLHRSDIFPDDAAPTELDFLLCLPATEIPRLRR